MWLQFILENLHFALYLLAAQALFAIFWLYGDAWFVSKRKREILRVIGFSMLCFSFILSASLLESSIVPTSLLPSQLTQALISITRIIGYLAIIASLLVDPIQERPKYDQPAALFPLLGKYPSLVLVFIYPFLALITGLLYWYHATKGLENHLKKIALGFFIITLSEFLSLIIFFQDTTNIALYSIVKPFGVLWCLQHLLLFVAIIVLARWVFSYLTKRLQSQLFLIFTSTTLCIFVITTTVFTTLLLNNMQLQTLNQISSDAKVLQFSLQAKKNETQFAARQLAQNPIIQSGVEKKSHPALITPTEAFVTDNNISSALILDDSAQILIKGEDSTQYGDSLSSDTLVKKALRGEEITSLQIKQGALVPELRINTVTPIKKDDKTIGAVLLSQAIDNAFLDGLKSTTNFESALYAGNQLTATTLFTSQSHRPFVIKENNNLITDKVIKKGEDYSGSTTINSTAYIGTYLALKDSNNNPIGMLFIGKPQSDLLMSAGKSIELAFLAAIVLIVITTIPTYYIAHSIASQLE